MNKDDLDIAFVRKDIEKSGRTVCNYYDSDCHGMCFMTVLICKTDAFLRFKGGRVHDICPILEWGYDFNV